MTATKLCILVSALVVSSMAQRGSFMGLHAIGYPEILMSTTSASLANKNGDQPTTTAKPLPVDALGDRQLVERLQQMPPDQQPFWLLNSQYLDEYRKHPQTYSQRPNGYVDRFSAGFQISPEWQ